MEIWTVAIGALALVALLWLFGKELLLLKDKTFRMESNDNQRLTLPEEAKANTNESCIESKSGENWAEEVIEQMLANMKVGCFCGRPCTLTERSPCFKCGKPCTYQPTVNGRPLYRCEWAVLQKGPKGDKQKRFIEQLSWYWTCSVCGMEPVYKKSKK